MVTFSSFKNINKTCGKTSCNKDSVTEPTPVMVTHNMYDYRITQDKRTLFLLELSKDRRNFHIAANVLHIIRVEKVQATPLPIRGKG